MAGTQFGVFLVLPLFRGIFAQSNKGVFSLVFRPVQVPVLLDVLRPVVLLFFRAGQSTSRRGGTSVERKVTYVESKVKSVEPLRELIFAMSNVESEQDIALNVFLSAGVFSGTFGLLVNTESVIEAELNMMLGTLLDSMDQLCALKMQGWYC